MGETTHAILPPIGERVAALEARDETVKSDLNEIKADIKTLLAMVNVGKGVKTTFKFGAALLGAAAAGAGIFHWFGGR